MPTLYDELGLPPTATVDELRRAYRERARRLHPDITGDDPEAAAAMRRVNEAWRVLGDPAARAAYDRSLAPTVPAPDDDGRPPGEPHIGPHRSRVSLWALLLAALAVIFVVTAYAGSSGPSGSRGSSPVGSCLVVRPGYEGFQTCPPGSPNRVVQEVGRDEACPVGTVRHQVQGRSQTVCLTRA